MKRVGGVLILKKINSYFKSQTEIQTKNKQNKNTRAHTRQTNNDNVRLFKKQTYSNLSINRKHTMPKLHFSDRLAIKLLWPQDRMERTAS